jgi:hypothetical protein
MAVANGTIRAHLGTTTGTPDSSGRASRREALPDESGVPVPLLGCSGGHVQMRQRNPFRIPSD